MEKNITLGTSADINFVVNSISNGSKSVVDGSKNLISSIKSLLQSGKQPIEWLQSYYSIIMEKEVSMKPLSWAVSPSACICARRVFKRKSKLIS